MSTREETVALAQLIRRKATRLLPPGARLVVVVTADDGDWVGVSSNAYQLDVMGILKAALNGVDYQLHHPPQNAIDAEAE